MSSIEGRVPKLRYFREKAMEHVWTRRGVLAAVGASAFIRPAAADQGVLAKLRKQGSMKIGIANNMPWSALNPDGTLSGIAPSIVTAVVSRLGIPKVEGVVVAYGELVPGLLAGRWDMVGASLTISPVRCKQVLFSDPFYRGDESQIIAFLPGTVPNPPKSYTEVAARFEQIGFVTGDAQIAFFQTAIAAAKSNATIVQFPDAQLLMEGLKTKRVPIVSADSKTIDMLQNQSGGFDIAKVDNGQPNRGSGGAFRREDTDLRDAFAAEFRALKKSGEVARILKDNGYVYDPKFMEISGDEACAL